MTDHFSLSRLMKPGTQTAKAICGSPRTTSVVLLLMVVGLSGLLCPIAAAQTGQWTWRGGSSVFTQSSSGEPGQPGVYGELGVAASTNAPGGRLGAVAWTDKKGNLWLFGGGGLDSAEDFGVLNDLWEFNVKTREWTWRSGSSTIPGFNGGQPGIYGKKGTPGPNNVPGGRTGGFGWTDKEGDLWLFGGAGFDEAGMDGNLNDLWKYSIAKREWTWIGGSSTLRDAGSIAGVYGTLGSLTDGSYPGSRNFGVTWTDKDGNLWLFGGYGEDSVHQYGPLNDLWKFVPSRHEWAWMSGSNIIGGTGWDGVYGTLGISAPGNTPGGLESSAGWVDRSGNLWLFGGYGYGFLNDVWKFSPSTNEWAWMGGGGSQGVYGSLGTPSPANIPGGRVSPVVWLDSVGDAWLMGGEGFDATGDSVGFLNDLWEFNPATNEWAWMGGPSTVSGQGESGAYGTLGVGNPGNMPGGRESAVAWTDSEGHFWLMGGDGLDANGNIGYLNDLWEYRMSCRSAHTRSADAHVFFDSDGDVAGCDGRDNARFRDVRNDAND